MTATESARRTATRAHRSSIQISESDLVKALTAKLGIKLVAFVVDKDTSTVSRWRSGSSQPGGDSLRALRTAYQVFQLLEHSEADATIRAWFMGMNPQLDDVSPLEALQQGLHREVLAAARAFLAGG